VFGTAILFAVTVCLVFLLGLTQVERGLLVRRHATLNETNTHDRTVHSRLRVGIIGCGAIAENSHLPALLSSPLVELVAICDVSNSRLSYIQRQFSLGKAIAALDYRQLFDLVDAVVLTLPNHLHTPVGCEFLSRGIHVLCEKPLAATRE